MKRVSTARPIGDGKTRYKVRLEGDPCIQGSHEARVKQNQIFGDLFSYPDLTACGPAPFERLSIYHDGERWVVECEAEVEVEAENPDGV